MFLCPKCRTHFGDHYGVGDRRPASQCVLAEPKTARPPENQSLFADTPLLNGTVARPNGVSERTGRMPR
jgi:hypothetical protein